MIQVTNVEKSFTGTQVLEAIDVTFDSQSTHVLLGASGCGKSTLIKIIAGLIKPDNGSVTVSGKTVRSLNTQAICQTFGYMTQTGGLFAHLTAKENVELAAKALGWSTEKRTERTQSLSETLQLKRNLLKNFAFQLSGGQLQRVSLMRALFLDPPYLLLDEPLSALDPITRDELQQELSQLFASLKKTVVWVTHDLHEAARIGDHTYLMEDGVIIQHGSIKSFQQHPASDYVRRFVQAQAGIQ